MITFEHGKRTIDILHATGRSWERMYDFWNAVALFDSIERGLREGKGRIECSEEADRIDKYVREQYALELLKKAADSHPETSWRNDDDGWAVYEGFYTTDGFPEGVWLEIGIDGDEVVAITRGDDDYRCTIFSWWGDERSKIEKYLPKDWRLKYAALRHRGEQA